MAKSPAKPKEFKKFPAKKSGAAGDKPEARKALQPKKKRK